MGPQFFQTGMGRQFFESTLPKLLRALENVAAGLGALPALVDELRQLNASRRAAAPPLPARAPDGDYLVYTVNVSVPIAAVVSLIYEPGDEIHTGAELRKRVAAQVADWLLTMLQHDNEGSEVEHVMGDFEVIEHFKEGER